jgi:hypothetical protein
LFVAGVADCLSNAHVCRTSATASTWSLNRLDALAAEVVDTLTALDDNTTPQQTDSSSSSSSSSVAGQHRDQQQEQQHGQQAAAVRQQAQRYPMQVLNAVNAVLFRRHGYSACNR